jgi:hypothetical protein
MWNWKEIIVKDSETEDSPLFLRNGSVTASFLDWLRRHDMTAPLHAGTGTFLIRGQQTQESFQNMMNEFYSSWESCGVKIMYTESELMVDESVRFGDAYCQLFTSDHLPLCLTDYSNCGRGTIGAIISLAPSTASKMGGYVPYLLTAAHVAYGTLQQNYAECIDEKEKIKTFNAKMHGAHYLRTETLHMDYSFLPLRVECDLRCVNADADIFVVDNLTNTLYASAKGLVEFWETLIYDPERFVDAKVYKRGIVTGETAGFFHCLTSRGTIEVGVNECE